jgi:hypothetical protein
MAANDGVRRGDSERTGDLEAKPPTRRGAQIDDGPAGNPTADYLSEYDAEATLEKGDDAMEGLTVVSEDDPNLGLTNFHGKSPDDWAADTEEAHNPPSRLTTDHLTDRSSTLTPKK